MALECYLKARPSGVGRRGLEPCAATARSLDWNSDNQDELRAVLRPVTNSMDEPIVRVGWRKHRKPLLVAAVVVAVGVVLLVLRPTARTLRVPVENLTIRRVERGMFHDLVALRGRVTPRDIVFIDAQEGGRVERVLVQSGDVVEAGKTLVEFGNTDLQLQVIEREARLIEQINNLRSIEGQLAQTRVTNERSLADIDYNLVRLGRLATRRNILANNGATSREEQEGVQDELDHYRRLRPIVVEGNAVQEALRIKREPEIRDDLLKLQQDLVVARGKLDSLIVRAPVSGRVTSLDLKVGQISERGHRLAEITPDTGFKVVADIDEYFLGRVRLGQHAQLSFDGVPVTLTVARIYPAVSNGTFTADLDFQGSTPPSLHPGQSAQGELQLGESRPALILPAGPFLEQSGGSWVFVADPDGSSASRRNIKVGLRNPDQVEVLSGLAAGEQVIVSDYRGLEKVERLELQK